VLRHHLIDVERLGVDRHGVDRHLEVAATLVDLFPERALVRGQIIRYSGDAARALALASSARATATGSWLAVVGVADLGVEAAVEFGIDLSRLVVVDAECGDHRRWVDLVGAAADGCELIITTTPPRLSERALRWVRQRVRSRGAVVLVLAEHDRAERDHYGADLGLDTRTSAWAGIEHGAGVLRARRVEVAITGRRVHRSRALSYWLPGVDGAVRLAEPRGAISSVVESTPAPLSEISSGMSPGMS
jgi:hypothetical protein